MSVSQYDTVSDKLHYTTNMFARLFKTTSLIAGKYPRDTGVKRRDDIDEFPLEEAHERKNIQLYLGHTVCESPNTGNNGESPVHQGMDELAYFQESLVDDKISPCESYVSIEEPYRFNPRDIESHGDKLATFIASPLAMSLLSVPGIGIGNNNILKKGGIYNTRQIIGQFLLFYGQTTSSRRLADKFYDWLGEVGIEKNRATITAAIAEKIGTWIPGIYDLDVYM